MVYFGVMPSLRQPLDYDDLPDSTAGSGYCAWCQSFVEVGKWWGDLCEKCGKEAQEALKEGRGASVGGKVGVSR